MNIEYKRKEVFVPDDIANGAAIRTLRQEHGMSMSELAVALDLSLSYVSELERGSRSISEDMFVKAKAAILKFKELTDA